MKKQHQTFIEAMAEHGDPVKAYLAAYPNVKETSARAAANRLLHNPEIAEAVAFDAKHMHKKAKAQAIKNGTKRVAQQLADIQSRREVLARVIFGTTKRKRFFKLDGEIVWVDDDIPTHSVLRAIELDCKLEAGFDWAGGRSERQKESGGGKKEPAKPGPGNPVAPKPEDVRKRMILIGDTLFAKEDAEWIERYATWKKANPGKVKEWTVESKERSDRFIEWEEDPEQQPGDNRHLVQTMRFGNGLPKGPFIPGESRYFISYEEQDEAYGIKPFHAPSPEIEIPNSIPIATGTQNPNPHPDNYRIPIPASGIEHPASSIQYPASNIEHPISSIQYPASSIEHPISSIQYPASSIEHPISDIQDLTSNIPHQQNVTSLSPSNPQPAVNMPENRKVYYTSDELWEAYKAALPAWPHLSEKTKRFTEQTFRNNSMSQQRLLLRLKLGDRNDKNSAA